MYIYINKPKQTLYKTTSLVWEFLYCVSNILCSVSFFQLKQIKP